MNSIPKKESKGPRDNETTDQGTKGPKDQETKRQELRDRRSEVRRRRSEEIPEWWTAVPAGERTVLRTLARTLRIAKRSPVNGVARAAAKWERCLGCFIRVRLMNQKRK